MHEGHRGRMVEKMQQDSAVLTEHELLEILLFNALPRVNTNPIAHLLLDRFGGIKEVLSAEIEELAKIKGLGKQGAVYLKTVGCLYERLQDVNSKLPQRYEKSSFYAFLKERMDGLTYEVLDLFILKKNGVILKHKRFTDFLEDEVAVKSNEVMKFIADYPEKLLIMAHNHPNGLAAPSKKDEELTKQLEVLCSINNILLIDHVIYGGGEFYSFYSNGKMKEISTNFHICSLLEKNE